MAISNDATATLGVNVHSQQRRMFAIFDVLFAAFFLMCLAPIILLAAAAIYLESGHPVFFSQIRLGRNGQPFWLYKLRKFNDRKLTIGGALTVENDPRLTRVGWFLERTKLDELPQLWNILKGEMSVVGPRPETPHFADCFKEYGQLFDYRPGIFGPVQAMFRNESGLHRAGRDPEEFYRTVLFPAKARIDLAYYPRRTVYQDVVWIILGILAVMGCSRVPQMDRNTVQEMENWVRRRALNGIWPRQVL